MSRAFTLGAILSVTTGRLVADFPDVHELLEYMAGEPVWTHQLPRVMDEATPVILAQHPQLEGVSLTIPLHADDGPGWVEPWLAEQVARFGQRLDLEPMAAVDHTSIHPLAELRLRGVPEDRIIVVAPPSEGAGP